MKRLTSFVAAWLLALPSLAEAPRDDFAYAIPLQVPAGASVARLDVPLPVYRDCVDPSLHDLRVLNGAGEVVPFSLQRPPADVRGAPLTLRLPLFALREGAAADAAALQLRIQSGATSIAVDGPRGDESAPRITSYLVDASNQSVAIDALRFDWPEDAADFAANVVLAASDDLVDWRIVVPRAPLARLRQGGAVFEQRDVPVPPTRARYWRVSAEPGSELPDVIAADATFVMGSVPVERAQVEVAGTTLADEPGVHEFDLGAPLPVDRLELVLPDVNTVAQVVVSSRAGADDAWTLQTSAVVYRLQAPNGELKSAAMFLPAKPARYWRVKVDPRGGGIGGGEPRLRAGWLADQLLFVARGGGPFEIVYGSFDAPAGDLPLASLLPGAANAGGFDAALVPVAGAGEPREAGGPERLRAPPPAPPWRAWLLWAALLAGVATLAALAWGLARQMRETS